MLGIFDTGSGGIDIDRRLRAKKFKTHLLLDDSFTGNDSKNIVKKKTKEAIKYFEKKGIKIIVIACHTAISSIYDEVETKTFPRSFIKKFIMKKDLLIFEPIIPTCDYILRKNMKDVTILCTALTKKMRIHEKYLGFKCNYISFKNLAEDIDKKRPINIEKLFKNRKISGCVVLACTHYSFIEDKIRSFLTKSGFRGVLLNPNKILVGHILTFSVRR